MSQSAKFKPGQLVEVRSYDGKPRDDVGEVYQTDFNYAANDWRIYTRCFTPAGQPPKFRIFFQSKLIAE